MMNKPLWDNKIEYLRTTRKHLWNDDYFEFLVNKVWKLNFPVNIVDFGCGYGYLGLQMLPLLPEESTYTGIDVGEELLIEAKRLYENLPYHSNFIKADLNNYIPKIKYDVAICQSVLRHISQPKKILKKMIDSVVDGGRVICIEVNRRMEYSGLYIDVPNFNASRKDDILNNQWEKELHDGERDFMLGIKVPIYMEQFGLKNVDVRVNDFVEFISPSRDQDKYTQHISSFMQNNIVDTEIKINADTSALLARSLLISYGIK